MDIELKLETYIQASRDEVSYGMHMLLPLTAVTYSSMHAQYFALTNLNFVLKPISPSFNLITLLHLKENSPREPDPVHGSLYEASEAGHSDLAV